MKDMLCVPVAIQLRVDDVAWHFGDDERYKDRPSRSGIPPSDGDSKFKTYLIYSYIQELWTL